MFFKLNTHLENQIYILEKYVMLGFKWIPASLRIKSKFLSMEVG
jgi:hypothetical protein